MHSSPFLFENLRFKEKDTIFLREKQIIKRERSNFLCIWIVLSFEYSSDNKEQSKQILSFPIPENIGLENKSAPNALDTPFFDEGGISKIAFLFLEKDAG